MATFYQRVASFPPVLCRLLARRPYGAPLTDQEIAVRSGTLSAYQVFIIGQSADWRGVDVLTLRAFTVGCGIDLTDNVALRRVRTYLRGRFANGRRYPPSFEYLRRSPEWRRYYKPLVKRWIASQPTAAAGDAPPHGIMP